MKYVFVGGLQRSGTTLVRDCIAEHPQVTSFQNTGVQQNEGQFLQAVYPNVNLLGGAGVFGFHPDAHLTEASPLVEHAGELKRSWSARWDRSSPIRLEKTPQNLVMARFLQAVFEPSFFVFVTRHPVVSGLATQKWSQSSLTALVAHWLRCHGHLADDLGHLRDFMIVRYEDFVIEPDLYVQKIFDAIGLEHVRRTTPVETGASGSYLAQWERARELAATRARASAGSTNLLPIGYRARLRYLRASERRVIQNRLGFGDDGRVNLLHRERPALERLFGDEVQAFGYSLDDLAHPAIEARELRGFAQLGAPR